MYANLATRLEADDQTSIGGAWSGAWLEVAGARHPASAYHEAAQDFVSEHNLLAHIHTQPPVPSFLAELPVAAPSVSITGAAFGAEWAGSHDLGDMVLSFIDERFGGAFSLPQPVGLTPFFPEEEPADTFVLADRTIIRLTGLLRGVSRNFASSASSAGLTYAV